MTALNKEQYPVGKFEMPDQVSRDMFLQWISEIAAFPERISNEVKSLTDAQLDTPYRDGGWTLRQVVHHCADSHINAVCRIKLALTEEKPVIKPYAEASWAELSDGKTYPIDASLAILKGLHERWAILLENCGEEDLQKVFIHPEHSREISIGEVTGLYAWHCRHHLAHITTLKAAKGWS